MSPFWRGFHRGWVQGTVVGIALVIVGFMVYCSPYRDTPGICLLFNVCR